MVRRVLRRLGIVVCSAPNNGELSLLDSYKKHLFASKIANFFDPTRDSEAHTLHNEKAAERNGIGDEILYAENAQRTLNE